MKALLAIFRKSQDHQLRGMYNNWRSEQMIPRWSPAFEQVTPPPTDIETVVQLLIKKTVDGVALSGEEMALLKLYSPEK